MTSGNEQKSREEIRQLLEKINQAWLKGRWEELVKYFHEDMVIIPPGFGERITGKHACVKGYREFTSNSVIHEYKESDHAIDLCSHTAVASYRYDISYEINGKDYHDTGHDLFVFVRQGESWCAVWRTLVPQLASK